ncbi:hypothetical protein M9H77_23142 [Catharanthus roseus]|uniref:Uncharacterized protein n=1 Tax=Catharanthus roseus TaxID=4058 RepID=A0ACC0ASF5_CATRO|nr:hypothetical protein M9H77_23142 [Catharanthus roseus]
MNSNKFGVIIIKEFRMLDKNASKKALFFFLHKWFNFEMKILILIKKLHHYIIQSNDEVSSIMEDNLDVGNTNNFEAYERQDVDEQDSDLKTPSEVQYM